MDYKRLHCWCVVLFSISFSFNLRNYILHSAKKNDMSSFSLTSLYVDLNEAAKCVDHIAGLFIAPSHTSKNYKVVTIFGLA